MIFSGVIFGLGYADKQYPVLIPRSTSEDLQVLRNATSIEVRGPVFQMMYRVTEAQDALAGYGISNQIIDYRYNVADIDRQRLPAEGEGKTYGFELDRPNAPKNSFDLTAS